MEKLTIDKQFSLRAWDWIKGLGLGVAALVLTLLIDQAKAGLGFDWNIIYDAAVSFIVTYLGKNYFSATKIVIEQPKEITTEAIKRVVK